MTTNGILLLSFLTFACQPTPTQTSQSLTSQKLCNILDIAGQTQEDIATILGHQSQLDAETAANSGCATCQKYSYKDGLIKIVYINDMADWITITPTQTIEPQQVPTLLGLPELPPDHANKQVLSWHQYSTINSIQAFIKPDGTLDYIYMKVTTP
jgi:hypothetical protein